MAVEGACDGGGRHDGFDRRPRAVVGSALAPGTPSRRLCAHVGRLDRAAAAAVASIAACSALNREVHVFEVTTLA